jgi:apolipoprotein N-acyltransferase
MMFGAGGRLISLYDKVHLVPFGEYLPWQATLEALGLEQLTRIRGGFDAGQIPRPLLKIAGLPAIGPLICYEAIFPGVVVQGSERPSFLLNVTNDGWFGQTTGPHQHLHQARVRAVEEGLPMLRVANNGISAVIDANGRVLESLGLDVKGVIDSRLPGALTAPPYARYGDGIFVAMVAAGTLGLAAFRARQRR